MSAIKAWFPRIFFCIYDDLTSDHAPGQLKYDACMTKQVSGPQGTKIAGRHMAMFPNQHFAGVMTSVCSASLMMSLGRICLT